MLVASNSRLGGLRRLLVLGLAALVGAGLMWIGPDVWRQVPAMIAEFFGR